MYQYPDLSLIIVALAVVVAGIVLSFCQQVEQEENERKF